MIAEAAGAQRRHVDTIALAPASRNASRLSPTTETGVPASRRHPDQRLHGRLTPLAPGPCYMSPRLRYPGPRHVDSPLNGANAAYPAPALSRNLALKRGAQDNRPTRPTETVAMSVDPPRSDHDSGTGSFRDADEAAGRPSPDPRASSTKTLKGSAALGRMPKEIGRYHVKRVIASGGMGTVYEAVQEHPRRTVAVKVMKHGIASRSAMRRFEYESQILARLRHPGIAQVYEAGTHRDDTGTVPFFAMEYIPNAKPITQYATEKKLGTRERLDLFGKVCDAVHHGHQKGIIHRDLKPSNILVDSTGLPRIIDFGVARATDSDLAVTTLQTDVGQLIGTLQYMSPEQCEADPHDLDTRSDVYALGVVLYELLCRKLPYDVSKVSVYEATRVVREHQPTSLSTIDRSLRGDVETIVFKALEKDRERRYQSAIELVQDIKRYLSGEAVVARPPSIVYQLRVFARRNKAFFSAVAAAFVVLVAGVIVSTSLYLRSETARRDASQAQAAEADQRKLAESERDRAIAAKQQARRQAYISNIAAAGAALYMDEVVSVRQRLDAAPEEFRNWEWQHLHAQAENSLAVLRGHKEGIWGLAFSPDGTRLASWSSDKTVRLWDVSTTKELAVLRGHGGPISHVAFSPDGTRLASASKSWSDESAGDNTVRVWDALTGKELAVLRGHVGRVSSVAYSPDGNRLASGSMDKTVRLWDVSTGEELVVLQGHEGWLNSVAFSPDGTRLATASFDKTVRLWDTSTGEELAVLRGHEDSIWPIAFSPDGTRLASGSNDKTVRLWNASNGKALASLRGHERGVGSVAFSPDGTRLASASWDKTIRLWDAFTGEELVVLQGHGHIVRSAVFSPDGTRLASASVDATVRVWDASTGEQLTVLRGHEDSVHYAAFSPDGTHLASGSADGTVRLWDASIRNDPGLLQGHEESVMSVAFSPDGTRLASASWDWTVRLWDASTCEQLLVLPHEGGTVSVAFSPDGTRLATASGDKTVRLWNASTGEELAVLRGHEGRIWSVAFSPDGTHLASASWDKTVRLWDTSTGEELAVLRGHEDGILPIAFSPDGTRLASGSDDKTVRLWNASNGEALAILRGHEGRIWSVAFSPDGTHLASAGWEDRTVRLWEASTGEELSVLRGHGNFVATVAFSPDGTRLASGANDKTIRLWDPSTGEELAVLRGHERGVGSVAFSPDGNRLVSGSYDKTLRLWDTVPYRIRYQERQAILAARPEANCIVDDLWQKCSDWKTVAERLREDATLIDPVRRAALNEVLRRATASRAEAIATPDEPGPEAP